VPNHLRLLGENIFDVIVLPGTLGAQTGILIPRETHSMGTGTPRISFVIWDAPVGIPQPKILQIAIRTPIAGSADKNPLLGPMFGVQTRSFDGRYEMISVDTHFNIRYKIDS